MVCNLVSACFNRTQLDNLNYWSREKGLKISSPINFVYDFFLKKIFLMLHSINWPNFTIWLPLLLEVLDNIWLIIVCFPGCDVIIFEIKFIFLIKSFLYMTEKSREKFNSRENEQKKLLRWNKKHVSSFWKGF